MEAFYTTSISFTGNKEERQAFARVLKSYTNREHSNAFFNFDHNDINGIENTDSKYVNITASGPWGNYGELTNVDIFREIAESVPNAEMYGHIEGSDTYENQDLKAKLKDAKLYIINSCDSYDIESGNYIGHIMNTLPYDKFIKLFKIDEDAFEFDDYVDFVESSMYDDEGETQSLTDLSFSDFKDRISSANIEEDEYNKVMESLRESGVKSPGEITNSGMTEKLIYDPVKKSYCKDIPFPSDIM